MEVRSNRVSAVLLVVAMVTVLGGWGQYYPSPRPMPAPDTSEGMFFQLQYDLIYSASLGIPLPITIHGRDRDHEVVVMDFFYARDTLDDTSDDVLLSSSQSYVMYEIVGDDFNLGVAFTDAQLFDMAGYPSPSLYYVRANYSSRLAYTPYLRVATHQIDFISPAKDRVVDPSAPFLVAWYMQGIFSDFIASISLMYSTDGTNFTEWESMAPQDINDFSTQYTTVTFPDDVSNATHAVAWRLRMKLSLSSDVYDSPNFTFKSSNAETSPTPSPACTCPGDKSSATRLDHPFLWAMDAVRQLLFVL